MRSILVTGWSSRFRSFTICTLIWKLSSLARKYGKSTRNYGKKNNNFSFSLESYRIQNLKSLRTVSLLTLFSQFSMIVLQNPELGKFIIKIKAIRTRKVFLWIDWHVLYQNPTFFWVIRQFKTKLWGKQQLCSSGIAQAKCSKMILMSNLSKSFPDKII